VDDAQFGRAKLPGAQHHLGVIGMAPWRKRLDLAVDVLERLRREDPRFTLFVKSKLPWDLPWIWNRTEERESFEALFRRIRRSPLLASGVVFDPAGPDVASWLRRVGFVLSTSDDESFHLAPAEGMASGAVPALLPWEGSDRIYDRRWIHEDPAAMAEGIAAMVAEGRWDEERAQARAEVRRSYALDLVSEQWAELVTRSGGAAAARTPTTYQAPAPSA
jgi:glycosyltransferase involved in cell wall biosynthesis